MSRGSDKHQARISEINSFGKDLARRSKSHCELCDKHGVKLIIHEVPPTPKEPDINHCIFICQECQQQINHPKTIDINYWHCLHTSIWSDEPAVQVMAILMAKKIANKAPFADELLEQVYLDDSIKTWLDQALSEK